MSGLLDPGKLLDSEVTVGKNRGKGVLQRTNSGLTSRDGEPKFTLWVFDSPLYPAGFDERYEDAAQLVRELNHPQIKLLKYKWIETFDELYAYLQKCLKKGYEGIVTRHWNGKWKDGKSTLREQGMLKIKPFDSAEGRVTGWYEEMENTNEIVEHATGKRKRTSHKAGKIAKGRLGGLILEDCKTGTEVRVGGGFTQDQRIRLWPIRETLRGVLVRYAKQRVGEKDKPRHPNFKEFIDFRPEWDMTD
jgi:DNA ligase-1